jgi:hypothetical protein
MGASSRDPNSSSGNVGDNVVPLQPAQLSLALDPTIVDQHRSLKECLAARIYQQRGGVMAVAGKLDMSPSHLSEVLGGGGDRHRKLDLDEFERYVRVFNDVTPVLYLVAKYLPSLEDQQRIALEQLQAMRGQLDALIGAVAPPKRKR